MKKIIKIVSVLVTVLAILTMPALGAYDAKNDHTVLRAAKPVPPVAALKIKLYPDTGQAPLQVKATDVSKGGEVKWKKWYVDGKIVSTDSKKKVLYWKFDNKGNNLREPRTHYIKLRVANQANANNPSEVTWAIDVYPRNPFPGSMEIEYYNFNNPRRV